MSSMVSVERGHRKWLVLASFLLVAATLVSSMPTRDGPQGESTTISSAGEYAAEPTGTSLSEPEQTPPEHTCAGCRREIPAGARFYRIPCGHSLHVDCRRNHYRPDSPHGLECPACGQVSNCPARLVRRPLGESPAETDIERFAAAIANPTGLTPRRVRHLGVEEVFRRLELDANQPEEEDDDDEEADSTEGGETSPENLCPICLKDVKEKASLECGHSFHKTCINKWFRRLISRGSDISCPMCRHIVQAYPFGKV